MVQCARHTTGSQASQVKARHKKKTSLVVVVMISAQVSPVKPSAQLHSNPSSSIGEQSPSFKQGNDVHGLVSLQWLYYKS